MSDEYRQSFETVERPISTPGWLNQEEVDRVLVEAREAYVEGRALAHVPYATSDAEFDRFIASVKAEVAQEIRAWARNIHPDSSPLETTRQAEAFLVALADRLSTADSTEEGKS